MPAGRFMISPYKTKLAVLSLLTNHHVAWREQGNVSFMKYYFHFHNLLIYLDTL